MSNINIHNADVLEYLKNYTGEKFHSVLADVPYGISFMGKSWDKYTPIQYQTWCSEWGSELIKHLYPGSVCMFFGGTRTYHRLATGLEDAGFEIFDSMIWCYGSGFPKSYNISKGIDSKFGLEREIEYSFNRAGRSSGILGKHVEITRNVTLPNSDLAHQYNGYGTALKPAFEPIVLCRKPRGKETFVDCALNYGTGSLNVDGSRVKINKIDDYGRSPANKNGLRSQDRDLFIGLSSDIPVSNNLGRFPANLGLICDCEKEPCECDYQTIGDSSRFFYTAKSSRKERNLGLDVQNTHPTVKPIKLIEYLATMLKPPVEDSSILIPFSGSGSEIIGAMFASWNIINAIEIDENYCNIAKSRVDYWKQFSTYDKGLKGK